MINLRCSFINIVLNYESDYMRQRQLGFTELNLTMVGLGTWAIGGPWEYGWGPQDDSDSMDAIFEAMDSGVNWIDTAPIYGCGHSESVVGRAIKGMNQKPLIATKCGLRWDKSRKKLNNLKAESIRGECDESLTRLGVDVIDLYQMHWPVPDEMIEEAFSAMAEMVTAGKVRYIGVSNFTIEQMNRVKDIHPLASVQPPYSMLSRDAENLFAYCNENKIGIVAYSPMQSGLLTGKFSKQRVESLAKGDYRLGSSFFKEPQLSKNLDLVEKLKRIASVHGKTVSQLAIAWVLRKEQVTSAIVGARRSGQIMETATASDWVLDNDILAEIESLLV